MYGRFADRADAGRALAVQLKHYAQRDDVVVLGLPRGGVPVAYEVARAPMIFACVWSGSRVRLARRSMCSWCASSACRGNASWQWARLHRAMRCMWMKN